MAKSVKTSAHVFRYEVLSASIIGSLEKNPVKNGVPVRARLPIIIDDVVKGIRLNIPPIFRMSCSLFKL